MTRLHLEPERIAGPEDLVSSLLKSDSKILDLFQSGAFDPAGIPRFAARPGKSPLHSGVFHCLEAGARDRLERILAGDGFVVTTGQQPQLFGGPLYVLYKALSAVRVAADIERRLGSPCLAVFWVAADDHDWREVASVGYLDREENLCRIETPAPPGRTGRSVGPSPLPPEISEQTREFIGSLETHEAGGPWLDLLKEQYVPGRSFTDAFIGVASRWLVGLPIAFLDSAHPEVRQASSPVFQRVLERREVVDEALSRGTDAVADLGHRAQLTHVKGAIPLFREGSGGRYRLRGASGSIQVDPIRSSMRVSDLVREAASEPERFSPSAALRPVLESCLLPVRATILGPGEIAYWVQLGPLFEALEAPMPGILPRDSWRVVEPRTARLLAKTGVTAGDLRDGGAAATAGLVERSRPRSVEEAILRLEDRMDGEFDVLQEAAATDLPGLQSAVGKSRSQFVSALVALRRTLDSMTRDRERTMIAQLHRVAVNFYPDGIPQERAMCTYVFLARHGDRFLEAARTAALGSPSRDAPGPPDGVAGITPAE